mgnify:CR=1 FL=1
MIKIIHVRALGPSGLVICWLLGAGGTVSASDGAELGYPVTAQQRGAALKVAQDGVRLSDLAAHAPSTYRVVAGDSLWAIAGLFLRQPWRWPELWGLNLQQIANPHRIYPGQLLSLDIRDGRARLVVAPQDAGMSTVSWSPRIRMEHASGAAALPTLAPHVIEPFFSDSMIVDAATLAHAARIVATPDKRLLLGVGDRAYARANPTEALQMPDGLPQRFLIVRSTPPIVHPISGQVLGYEAHAVGRADLVREGRAATPGALAQPATVVVRSVRQEVQVGDRLLPVTALEFPSYAPHVPYDTTLLATVVAVPDDVVALAGPNQVVLIDRGAVDGIDIGTVFAVQRAGQQGLDSTRADDAAEPIELPEERQGLLMVFRVFHRLSYALILQAQMPVVVGDQLVHP